MANVEETPREDRTSSKLQESVPIKTLFKQPFNLFGDYNLTRPNSTQGKQTRELERRGGLYHRRQKL